MGLWGAIQSAKMATRTIRLTTASPNTAPRFSRNECHRALTGEGGAVRKAGSTASVGMADARVDEAVERVNEEIGEDDEARDQHDAALERGIVAPADRLDEPVAHPRPREDGFGQHRAGKQGRALEADGSDD